MSNETLAILMRLVLASSLAMLVVLGLRLSARRVFGAGISYALWLLVPISMLAIFVPRPASLPMVVAEHGQPMFDTLARGTALTSTNGEASQWIVMVWLLGALLSFALTLLMQWRLPHQRLRLSERSSKSASLFPARRSWYSVIGSMRSR